MAATYLKFRKYVNPTDVIKSEYDTRTIGTSGVIIEKMFPIGRGVRQTKSSTVVGLNGTVYFDDEAHNNWTTSMTINCNGCTTPGDIYSAFSGAGWLYNSETGRWRWVNFYSAQQSTRFRLTDGKCFDSVTISMECDPFEYEQPNLATVFDRTADTTAKANVSSGIAYINNVKGTEDCRPMLCVSLDDDSEETITCDEASVQINGASITITGLDNSMRVWIDSDTRMAYCTVGEGGTPEDLYNNGVKVDIFTTGSSDDWPKLVIKRPGYTPASYDNIAIVDGHDKLKLEIWHRPRWY